MNRLDFFKEMKTGLIKTVASIYEPVMEDDIEKVHKITDQLLGVKWFYLINDMTEKNKVVQKRINGRPFIIFHNENKLKAYSGICSFCNQLLYISAEDLTCHCFTCEKEIHFNEVESTISDFLMEYPLKKEKNEYYIGLKKNVQDGQYA